MHVLHVVRDLDAMSGGPSRSVPALARALVGRGTDCTVLFGDQGRETTITSQETKAKYISLRRSPLFRRTSSDNRHLSKLAAEHPVAIIHLHGLWNGLNHSAARFARRHAIPLIVTPRGMLEPWCLQQKRLKKQLALWLFQRKDLRHADVLHATSEAEAKQLRNLGFTGKIAVIPNGTAIPEMMISVSTDRTKRRVLFLSRLHPKKGIDDLIHAWNTLAPADWECIIAGPDEGGYLSELKQLHRKLGSLDSIRFHESVDGTAKWELMRSADLFVLPSHSENFGIVVAEALACGVPVITTRQTPWQELETCSCGWWIEDSVEALTKTLRMTLAMSREDLVAMGQCGKALVEGKYTWQSVARKMRAVYFAILDGTISNTQFF